MRMLRAVTLLALVASLAADGAAAEPGFAPIFNGEDLDGWVVMGAPEGFEVVDGVILSEAGKGGHWIRTEKQYGNFVLRIEWMLSDVGNSGILIRTGEKGVGPGFEVQLLAPWTPTRDDLHCTGSIYGHVPVDPRPDETPNRWRSMEVACRYKDIRVALDDQIICRANMDKVESLKTRSLRGHIGMQASHSGRGQWVKFRNIRIRDLDREPSFVTTGLRSSDATIRGLAQAAAVRLGAPMVGPLLDMMSERTSKSISTAEAALFAVVAEASVPGDEQSHRAVSGALAEQIEAAASDRARAYAARMLGILGGESTGSTRMSELSAGLRDPATFDAALSALERIDHEQATQVLLGAAEQVAEEQQPRVIRALGGRQAPLVLDRLLRIATGPQKANRVAALDALGMSADRRAAQTLADAATDSDADVRRAACAALIALADPQRETDAPFASRLFRRAFDHAVTPAQRTAAILGLSGTDPAGRVRWLFAGLAEDHSRPVALAELARLSDAELVGPLARRLQSAHGAELASLLRLASQRGVPGIEAKLLEAAATGEESARVAALDLLAASPRLSYAPLFQQALEPGTPDTVRVAGAKGCLVVGDLARQAGDEATALDAYRSALEGSTDVSVLKGSLAGVAAIGDPQLMPLVARMLGNVEVRQEAGAAYLVLADAAAQAGDKAAAIDAYTTLVTAEPLLNAGDPAGARLRELGIDRDFAGELGFIIEWSIIGPFPNANQSAYEKAFFPESEIDLGRQYEQDGQKLSWCIHHETGSVHGIVELLELFPAARDVACYAYAEVTSDAEREVLIKFGTDDGFALWLNGKRLAGNAAGRALTVDQDTVKARLIPGTNRILLKVLQGGSRWAFCLRVMDSEGKPLALPQADE